MILLVSPYPNATDCAALIEGATREQVKTVDSVRVALAALRSQSFVAVVVDENLLECSPDAADALVQRMESATPVFLDMACMRAERIAKFVTLAIRRRQLEYKAARETAIAELRSELKSEVTGLLLSSEIAMKHPSVPVKVNESLITVLESARRIRQKLEK